MSLPNNAITIMRKLGLEPDPWQSTVLESSQPRLLLNCCRQAGKSTAVAMLALVEAVFVPGTCVLILSRSYRQSMELFRVVVGFHGRLGGPMQERRTVHELELANHSRIVCLPCREETIRGYANVNLLIIDEAARVPDDLYKAVRPMLAVSAGRLICLSTPYGKRGFFYDCWTDLDQDWQRIEVPAKQVPRIPPEFLAEERRALGPTWFRQEFCCSFEAMEGLVYPDFDRCVAANVPPALPGRRVGGLDFGYRNPFAAVWGTLDKADVLWLTGEHYSRGKTLSHHADHLPRDVEWFADPAGAGDRAALVCAGFTVRPGVNALSTGISAVVSRIETGRLRVQEGRCPNLLAEAQLYRYGQAAENGPETPLSEHNHALDALRYLINTVDQLRLARPQVNKAGEPAAPETPRKPQRSLEWYMLNTHDFDDLWTTWSVDRDELMARYYESEARRNL